MKEIEVGDTVVLKSGSPLMTINNIKDNGSVECCFFIKNELCFRYCQKETLLLSTEDYESSLKELYELTSAHWRNVYEQESKSADLAKREILLRKAKESFQIEKQIFYKHNAKKETLYRLQKGLFRFFRLR